MRLNITASKTIRIHLPQDSIIVDVQSFRGSATTQKGSINRLDATTGYPGEGWVYVWGTNVTKSGRVGKRRVNGAVPISELPQEIQDAIERSGVFS